MQDINLDQAGRDTLSEMGLIDKYPLHVDIANNETGFALYMDVPLLLQDDGHPLGNDEWEPDSIHHTDYDPNDPVLTWSGEYWADRDFEMRLRIREVNEDGQPGEWHRVSVTWTRFSENNDPPAALDRLGFDQFDAVTWLEGLEPGKDYQVQLWFDLDDNGRLDSQGRFERSTNHVYNEEDGTWSEEPGDWYYWQAPDLYSGVHSINTDPEAFNVDIDSDGAMDFFIS